MFLEGEYNSYWTLLWVSMSTVRRLGPFARKFDPEPTVRDTFGNEIMFLLWVISSGGYVVGRHTDWVQFQ